VHPLAPATAAKAPAKVAELPKNLETSVLPPPPPPITAMQQQQTPPSIGHDFVKKSNSSPASTAPSPVALTRAPPPGLPPQPSVYEMAALTQDLDTQLITTKIKEALLANNIGQKVCSKTLQVT